MVMEDEIRPRIRVAALIVNEQGVLMVRHRKGDAAYWMLPGGGVDYGETLPVALQREIREELCVEIDVHELRFVNDSVAPNADRHIVNIHFAATIVSGAPRLGEDDRIVDVAYQPLEALPDLTMRPDYGARLHGLLATGTAESPTYWGTIWRAE